MITLPLPLEAWAQRSPRTRWPLVLLLIVLLIGLAGGITSCGAPLPDCLNHPETCT